MNIVELSATRDIGIKCLVFQSFLMLLEVDKNFIGIYTKKEELICKIWVAAQIQILYSFKYLWSDSQRDETALWLYLACEYELFFVFPCWRWWEWNVEKGTGRTRMGYCEFSDHERKQPKSVKVKFIHEGRKTGCGTSDASIWWVVA